MSIFALIVFYLSSTNVITIKLVIENLILNLLFDCIVLNRPSWRTVFFIWSTINLSSTFIFLTVQTAKGTLYKIAVIADPDTDSKVPDKTHVWRSFMLKGSLYWDGPNQKVDLVWETDHNEIRYSGLLIKITINSFHCIHS